MQLTHEGCICFCWALPRALCGFWFAFSRNGKLAGGFPGRLGWCLCGVVFIWFLCIAATYIATVLCTPLLFLSGPSFVRHRPDGKKNNYFTFNLTFYLAYLLAYLLAFYLAYLLIYSDLSSGILSGILFGILSSISYLLTFFLKLSSAHSLSHIFLHEVRQGTFGVDTRG